MIELVSINVENFRSFSEASFAPLGVGQGMTAINGANGMGKSTMVHALLWAIYGITPDGVPVKALRRQNSDGDVVANVIIRHEGQTIEVTRSLRGRNDTTMATISLDGVEQTNISSKTATSWMQKRLNLDAEAFLTAYVVRQKELDSLVKARPAERRKTIERLAGIERMSSALTLARQEARDAQKMLEALPLTVDPEEAEKVLKTVEAALNDAVRVKEAAENDYAEKKTAADDAKEAASELVEEFNAVKTLQNSLTLLEQKIDSVKTNISRVENVMAGADDLPFAQSAAEEARSNLREAELVLSSVDAAVVKAGKEAERLEEAENELTYAKNALKKAEETLEALKSEIDSSENVDDKILESEKRVEILGVERGAARGEWDRLKKAIDTLNLAVESHDAECPTCAQHLKDPTAVIELQENLLEEVYARGVDLSARYDAAVAEVSSLKEQKNKLVALQSKLENAENVYATAVEEVERKQKNVDKISDEVEDAAEIADTLQKKAKTVSETFETLKEVEQKTQTALRKAETAASAVEEYATYVSELDGYETEKKNLASKIASALKTVEGVDFDEFKAKVETLTSEANLAGEVLSSAKTAALLADRDVSEAKAAYDKAVQSGEVRKAALAKVEITSAAAGTLEEFRRDRLARLAPELSEVASDFVAKMTDGRYVSVELDEDFTPILTDASGAQRPSAWLSGGEESAVALALRVAIGEVLAGQRGGLLILDEVLTAQDQSRRTATMAAIRALPRQIITINHVSESTDMVDLVAEIIYDESVEGASTVSVYSPDNGMPTNLTDSMLDA